MFNYEFVQINFFVIPPLNMNRVNQYADPVSKAPEFLGLTAIELYLSLAPGNLFLRYSRVILKLIFNFGTHLLHGVPS